MTTDWQIVYQNIPHGPKSYGQESILTLGNGYLGWRGAPVTTQFSDDHYPGLYVAGVFNQTTTVVNHRDIVNEDMVNLPNPQLLRIFVDNQEVTVPYDQRKACLNMDQGTLVEHFEYPLAAGRLKLDTVKVCDPVNYHQLALKVNIQLDFAAQVKVQLIVDGKIKNQNVQRYREFNSQEFAIVKAADHFIHAETLASKITLAVGAVTTSDQATFTTTYPDHQVVDQAQVDLAAQENFTIERVMAVATSYESSNPIPLVKKALTHSSFTKIQTSGLTHWQAFWQDADVQIESDDPDLQRLVRMNIFHLHQAAQKLANKDLDASVGSRALTGEGYRGHIFWDELFLVPYYATVEPDTAKDILQYRLKRLTAAKKNARAQYEHGAMYPWQSAMYGDEQSQSIHLNPLTHRWYQDNSRLQRHVSLAVVYNIWSYTRITGDYSLLREGGLKVLLETTKFWLSKVTYDGERYHLSGVMGPDEFHEAYPQASVDGLSDNAYTNIMLVWSLNWLLDLRKNDDVDFAGVCAEVDFDELLVQKASDVASNLALFVDDAGVIEQYQHYFNLKDLDLDNYRQKYGDIHRIDRILKSEDKSSNDYQVNKQADALMAVYNLGEKMMQQLVAQLGYQLPKNWLRENRDYYLARTVHGSTVSRPVFAAIDVLLGELDHAVDYLITAIKSDFDDIQGGTTAEGIHTGVMGGTLSVIEHAFAGVKFYDRHVLVEPKIPHNWSYLSFAQRFHGTLIRFTFRNNTLCVEADQDICIIVQANKIHLSANRAVNIVLNPRF
ncbi:glycoside hydrolase family 65 protein [Lapidilactobacillus wuchangensis]|uniref:glycoside hydrolase family 65 protein n=1 Tax=Lapidilactobacillus wuchangensis TaxID=2486001 RepID=UPI001CDC7B5C|nr:glycoside hydrolase family 65 protein [Lapidilactobacillus wuchangensis]